MDDLPGLVIEESTPIKVLLVEDDRAEAQRVRAMLAASDVARFEISHATHVEQALQMLQDGRYDVMLLDLTLPEGDGLDTLARAKVATSSIPIIVMTEEADEAMALNALRLGAQDYLLKSASDRRALVRTLRHAVERHRILTELSLARQREHFIATHDSLTGLPNRFAFRQDLQRAVAFAARSSKQLAVLFIDLDRFKHINDTLGHPVGDELLKTVADRLSAQLRSCDIVTRIGGDEFIVLVHGVNRDYAPAKIAQKLVDALGKPYALEGREYWLSASVGIAVFPRDGTDPDVLIRNADTAMYSAKKAGRGRYHYYAEHMNEVAAARLHIESDLREAIDRNEFVVHFQPQISISRRVIMGAEALVRWKHRERGMVPPAEFIPVAEESDVIRTLGELVLRQSCEQAVRWESTCHRKLRLSVNVSARQLTEKGFSDVVVRVLRETGLDPTRLDLEITESSVLQERGLTLASLLVLRRLGVRILVDDFGTGYASIAMLKTLPLDGLKIDRSFVRGLTTDVADAGIVGGLIKMARGLGIEVIAEGVEQTDQMHMLQARGCDLMQGYLFGKPMSDTDFTALLRGAPAAWQLAERKPDDELELDDDTLTRARPLL